MDKQHGKRIGRTRRTENGNNIHFPENGTKKYQIRKRQAIKEYTDSGSKFTIHDRQALKMNRCLQES